jgi:hypothetical protein
MSDSEIQYYSTDSDEEEPPPTKRTVKASKTKKPPKEVVEEVVEETSVKKTRKPLSEDQRQNLRDRLSIARERKAELKASRELDKAKALVKSKKIAKPKKVKVVEPDSPPPAPVKPKRVYKKKVAPVSNPF